MAYNNIISNNLDKYVFYIKWINIEKKLLVNLKQWTRFKSLLLNLFISWCFFFLSCKEGLIFSILQRPLNTKRKILKSTKSLIILRKLFFNIKFIKNFFTCLQMIILIYKLHTIQTKYGATRHLYRFYHSKDKIKIRWQIKYMTFF